MIQLWLPLRFLTIFFLKHLYLFVESEALSAGRILKNILIMLLTMILYCQGSSVSPLECSLSREGHGNGSGIKPGPKLGSDTLCRIHIREPSIHFIITYVWLHHTLLSIGTLHLKKFFLRSLVSLGFDCTLANLLNPALKNKYLWYLGTKMTSCSLLKGHKQETDSEHL